MPPPPPSSSFHVAIVGGGPAGLMAAETLAAGGVQVDVFDAMPSVGRKFLLAGKGGLNITHSEAFEAFAGRYGSRRAQIEPMLKPSGRTRCGPGSRAGGEHLRRQLGAGLSGRDEGRAAAARLAGPPARRRRALPPRHRWTGWGADGSLLFTTPSGPITHSADATLLALGGGSWARLGSDGAWVPLLAAAGLAVAPLQPANCGFVVASPRGGGRRLERAPGQPLRRPAPQVDHPAAGRRPGPPRPGEAMLSADGIEGSLVYALSAAIREGIARDGRATVLIDLAPGAAWNALRPKSPTPRRPLAGQPPAEPGRHRRPQDGAAAGMPGCRHTGRPRPPSRGDQGPARGAYRPTAHRRSHQHRRRPALRGARREAHGAKPPRPLLRRRDARLGSPTGGYLLTACFASGRRAAEGVLAWLAGAQGQGNTY
jgi:predicted flavoprotein YhiN